jgi:anti-sigma regulatory factor (Ser/Thr protein kinase)
MKEQRITVRGDAANLPALTVFLQDFWSLAGLPPAAAAAFELALEEVFMNVAMHGSRADAQPRVEVSLMLVDGGVSLIIEDDGPAFDPLALPAPDVTARLESRPVGGLGVFLVRQMMDGVRYQRLGGCNQLRMTKHLPGNADTGAGSADLS